MLKLSPSQADRISLGVRERFVVRLREHWKEQFPSLVACFSEDELVLMAQKVMELSPEGSEAHIALSGDLWLNELARRRDFKKL